MLSHWTALGFQREKKKEIAIVKKLYKREVTVLINAILPMNSKGLQCGDSGSQGEPSYSLVLSIGSTLGATFLGLEILGEIFKFPMPIPIKSGSPSRKLRWQHCQVFPGDSTGRSLL